MKRKTFVSVLAVLMAVVMVLSLILSVLPVAFAVEQSDIDRLQQEREGLAADAEEARQRLEELQSQQSSALEQKAALEVEFESGQKALKLVAEELQMYDDLLVEKHKELDAALEKEAEQAGRYRARVRAMEEDGGFNILTLLMHSKGLAQLLSALDDAAAIMESDKALEAKYREARRNTERVTEEYESFREECSKKQEALRKEQTDLAKRIDDVNQQLEDLSAAIEEAKEEYEQQQAAEEAAAQSILAMIAEYDAQKRREEEERRAAEEAANQGGEQPGGEGGEQPGEQPGGEPGGETGGEGGETGGEGGGETGGETGDQPAPTPAPTPKPTPTPKPVEGWVWPVPCSTRITSRFGNRKDPFTGQTRYHSGIDIDGYGNDGKKIVAAKSGTVIASTSNDGYGNYVIIDHGDGYKTLYGHMSSRAVKYGDWVNQGQTIGYLGHTGRATGTHCHFEVFIWGERTDPEAFYTWMNLSYWNC